MARLAQYQCTEATKEDTLALIRSLNKALATPHDEGLSAATSSPSGRSSSRNSLGYWQWTWLPPPDFVETEADVLAGYKLSAEARTLLVTAAAADGQVLL